MRKNTFKLTALTIATSLTLALTGCFDDDDDDHSNSHVPVEATGQFIDAAVANLDVYQNGEKIDTTDAEGMFTYWTGSDVTFKLGQLTLGSTMGKDIVTPADLSADMDTVVEILQILQSLDEDNNLENGIFIPPTIIDKLVTKFDPADEMSLIEAVKQDLPDLILVSEEQAVEHFSQSQQTVQTSNELSAVADKFVGFWQQSCEYGTQEVVQYTKDSVHSNILKQEDQYLYREYDNEDCTGNYVQTVENNSTDAIERSYQLMGTSADYGEYKTVNALLNEFDTEDQLNYVSPVNVLWLNETTFSEDGLSYTRVDSLAFDDTLVDGKAEILAGYWKSKCMESTNGSKKYYLNNVPQGDGTLLIKQSLREDFTGSTCSGTGIVTVNEEGNGKVVPQSDLDAAVINGNNQFISNGNTIETYDRINESDFPGGSEVPVDGVEQTVDAIVGYWKSECLVYGNESELVYLKISKVNNTSISQDVQIIQEFNNSSCSGQPVNTYDEGVSVIDFSNDDLPVFSGQDNFRFDYYEDGQPMSETYNRISEAEFSKVDL